MPVTFGETSTPNWAILSSSACSYTLSTYSKGILVVRFRFLAKGAGRKVGILT